MIINKKSHFQPMSTKIPALPLPLSPHHQDQLPPLVAHYPRWSRNTPVASTSILFSNRSLNSEFGEPITDISGISKTSTKSSDSVGKSSRGNSPESKTPVADPYRRINQLELNMRSLQMQHSTMLTSLHDEIESLRHQNKELQFQLVFKTKSQTDSTGPTLKDDSMEAKTKEDQACSLTKKDSSKDADILELKLSAAQASLEDADAKNSHLTAIIEDQKMQMAKMSQQLKDPLETDLIKGESKESETSLRTELDSCISQLNDAERLIQILRKENDEQQSEIRVLKNASNKANHSSRKNNRNHHQQPQRFPPLMHWQSQNMQNNSDWSSARGNSGRGMNSAEGHDHRGYHVSVSLPQVQNYNGQNNCFPVNNHHSHNNRRGNQNHRSDDRDRNLHAQGFRKHLNGTRRMSQESN